MIRIRAAAVIPRDGEILLVCHRKGDRTYWLLPGGGVEQGESIEACARREVREETGLDITLGPLLFVSETIAPDRSRHILHLTYLAEVTGGALTVGEDPVLQDARYWPIASLETLDLRPPLAAALAEAAGRQFHGGGRSLGPLWVNES